MNLDADGWRSALGLGAHETPHAVILEGTWWERRAFEARLSRLRDVRPLAFPGYHVGRWQEALVVFTCAYGAPKAVEPVHALGSVGTPLVVQIGSCGAIRPGIATGDVVVPDRAAIGEGASQWYGGADVSHASPTKAAHARRRLREGGFTVHGDGVDDVHLTTSALFAQPADRVAEWQRTGFTSVDMETSAVFTAAAAMGMEAVAMTYVWDELQNQRTFLDSFTEPERQAQARANEAIFDVALHLALEVAVATPERAA